MSEPERARIIADLCRSLREEQRRLTRDPHVLFQQLYNRVQWQETALRDAAEEARGRYVRRGRSFLHQFRRPRVEQGYLGLTLAGHSTPVQAVDMSRDGTRIVSGDRGGTAVIWDAESGRSLAVWPADLTLVSSVAFSPDGRLIATTGRDKALRIWSLEQGLLGSANLREFMDHLVDHTRARYSPDGTKILTLNYRTLKVWDAASCREIAAFREHGMTVNDCAWSPDGGAVVSVGCDKTPRVWDGSTGRTLRSLPALAAEILCCAWSPDGTRIAMGSIDSSLTLWDAVQGREIATLKGHMHFVTACAFSPDGRRLATSCLDHTVRLWDGWDGRELAVLRGHSGGVRDLAWSEAGAKLISCGEDKTIRIWELESPRQALSYAAHAGTIQDCQWSPSGSHAVSAGWEGTLQIWDAGTATETAVLRPGGRPGREAGEPIRVIACSFSPDGSRMASATQEGSLDLWASPAGGKIASWTLSPGTLVFFAWSPDGARLAVAAAGGPNAGDGGPAFTIRSSVDASPLVALDGAPSGVLTGSFSPDGQRILAVGRDETLGIWDAGRGRKLAQMKPHAGGVTACYWSPDNRHIVSASRDKTLKIWDTGPAGSALALSFVLAGHTEGVGTCAFSPDGRRLVSGSADRTLRIWDCGSGRTLALIDAGEFPIARCGWSPDGRWIASACIYGGVRVWDGLTGSAVAALESERAGRAPFFWSPEGGRLFYAGVENALAVWDVRRRGDFAVAYADAEITAFSVSPDGRSVVVGDVTGGICFFRIVQGEGPVTGARRDPR